MPGKTGATLDRGARWRMTQLAATAAERLAAPALLRREGQGRPVLLLEDHLLAIDLGSPARMRRSTTIPRSRPPGEWAHTTCSPRRSRTHEVARPGGPSGPGTASSRSRPAEILQDAVRGAKPIAGALHRNGRLRHLARPPTLAADPPAGDRRLGRRSPRSRRRVRRRPSRPCGSRGPDRGFGFGLTRPPLLVTLVLLGYPLVYSFWVSLHQVTLGSSTLGLRRARQLRRDRSRDPLFWPSLQRTLTFALIVTVFTTVARPGFALAPDRATSAAARRCGRSSSCPGRFRRPCSR